MTTHAIPSLSERYQEATKYTPSSVRAHPPLDFHRQPAPFKAWHQARRVVLPRDQDVVEPGPLDRARLARLLHHAYGVTLVREAPGMSLHYRAAPSAGGLYPTELYVATHGVDGVPDGLFAYEAREHALVLCWEGDFRADLADAAFGDPAVADARAVLVGTGVHARSAWRYGDRAYRRVLLDAGHVLGGAVLAAPAEGLAVVPRGDFRDARLEDLLLLDPSEEGVLFLAPVRTAAEAPVPEPAPLRSTVAREAAAPAAGAWIEAIHRAGRMDGARPADPAPHPRHHPEAAAPAHPLPPPRAPEEGARTRRRIRRRRSTRAFAPDPVPAAALGHVLGAAAPPRTDRLAPDLLDTWVVNTGVRGIAPGVHAYDAETHALRPVRLGHPREALHRACLWQELGRDCGFALVHTLDLPRAVAMHGERAYRSAHLEAGLVGQHASLAAPRAGLGASGIGGFFDDDLADLLQLPAGHAVVYVTVFGLPA